MPNNCIHVQVKSEVGRRGGIPLVMAAIRSSFILPCFNLGIELEFLFWKICSLPRVGLSSFCLFYHVVY
jgi:hypothetical protein